MTKALSLDWSALIPDQPTLTEVFSQFQAGRRLTPQLVAGVFNIYRQTGRWMPLLTPPERPIRLPYNRSTINSAARDESNLLFYSYGLSLYELYFMFGSSENQEPRFCGCKNCKDKAWWLNDQRGWAAQKRTPGCSLISLNSELRGLPYREQNLALANQWNGHYIRAPLHLLAEAYFAAKLINKENLFGFPQWGNVDYDQQRVWLGSNKGHGHWPNSLIMQRWFPQSGHKDVGVYRLRLPDLNIA